MKKRIMRSFTINEISAVDRPAQIHARATIMKREADPQLPEAIAKYYFDSPQDPANGAKTFEQLLQANMEQERYYEVMKEVGSAISALDCSLRSILGDTGMDTAGKQLMMRNSVEEFLAAIRTRWPDVEEALQKGLNSTGEDEMKTMAELQKQVEELTETLKKAQEATPDAAKMTELQTKLDDTSKQLKELTEKLEASEAEKAEATQKAGMSDEEKAYMASLDKDGKAKFMGMAPADRKKQMKKRDEEDEVIKVEGREIRKSVVGDDQFEIMKSQAERLDKQEKAISAERDLRLTAEYSKRAGEELKHLPGEVVAKVAVLKAMDKMDEATRATLTTLLKAGEEAIAKGFTKIGTRDGTMKKTGGDFEKKVDDIRKRDNISRTEALSKARKEFPDEFTAYQEVEQAAA